MVRKAVVAVMLALHCLVVYSTWSAALVWGDPAGEVFGYDAKKVFFIGFVSCLVFPVMIAVLLDHGDDEARAKGLKGIATILAGVPMLITYGIVRGYIHV